mgnify:CR=1 FL=1
MDKRKMLLAAVIGAVVLFVLAGTFPTAAQISSAPRDSVSLVQEWSIDPVDLEIFLDGFFSQQMEALQKQIDDMEERLDEDLPAANRRELADIRRSAIHLRRFMFPQRDALSTLEIENLPFLAEHDRSRIREAASRVTRLAEELDAIRDRAQIVYDEIMDRRSEVMNRNTLR